MTKESLLEELSTIANLEFEEFRDHVRVYVTPEAIRGLGLKNAAQLGRAYKKLANKHDMMTFDESDHYDFKEKEKNH